MLCTLLWLQCTEIVSTTIVLTMLHLTRQQNEKVVMTKENNKSKVIAHYTKISAKNFFTPIDSCV